jgi:hypothetical protein
MPSPVQQRRATPSQIQPQCPNGAPGTGNRALRATHRFTIENPLPLFGEALASVHKSLRLCDLCKELAFGTSTRK